MVSWRYGIDECDCIIPVTDEHMASLDVGVKRPEKRQASPKTCKALSEVFCERST